MLPFARLGDLAESSDELNRARWRLLALGTRENVVMNERTVTKSRGLALRGTLWSIAAVQMTCLALGLLSACSGAEGDVSADDDHETAGQGGNDKQEAVPKTAEASLAAASTCQKCEPKVVCEQKFVPCDPPVLVNGRNITCLIEDCREEQVCTPCGGDGDTDQFSGIRDLLSGAGEGGRTPPTVDPLPFTF